MEEHRRDRLVDLMEQMAAGDKAAIFALAEEFGGQLSAVVRRHLRHVGVHDVDREELDGLVIDVCLALFDCAQAWDPGGGALPWVWAERRIVALVSRHVGQHHDELDDRLAAETGADLDPVSAVATTGEPDPMQLLHDLARGVGPAAGLCRLVGEALELVSNERDRSLVLEVLLQASLGDRAPSTTAAALHGMRPDAVRQAVKRTRDRLRELAQTDPRFAPLADLPLLAA